MLDRFASPAAAVDPRASTPTSASISPAASSSTARQGWTRRPRDAFVRRCRPLVRAVSIAGLSSSSSPGTSPTTSPSTPICASSPPWRIQRRRRSDQPITRLSSPSTSPSTRLPPIEPQVAIASSLRTAALPPEVFPSAAPTHAPLPPTPLRAVASRNVVHAAAPRSSHRLPL